MCKVKYEVYEGNGGSLTLAVICRCGNPVYIYSGYEYNQGQLTDDLKELEQMTDVDDLRYWENNELPNQPGLYESLKSDPQNIKLICEGDSNKRTLYPYRMGRNGQTEFGTEED